MRLFEHLLVGLSAVVLQQRAQALVAHRHIVQRRRQRRRIQPAVQPRRQRDVVGRVGSFQPIQEPQPRLRERQRQTRRPVLRRQGMGRPRRLPHPLGQIAQPRRLEHRADAQHPAQHAAHSRHQPRRQQRVAAEREEVVLRADPFQAQQLADQAAQNRLFRRPRNAATHLWPRRRQRLAVHLPVRRQRQRVQHHDRRRNHIVRKNRQKMPAQCCFIERTPYNIGNQPQFTVGRRLANHLGLLNTGRPQNCGCYLAGLYPDAAKLELIVDTSLEYELTIHSLVGQIAGSIEPFSRLKGTGDEAGGGLARTPPVAAGEVVASDVEFSRLARTAGLQSFIEKIKPRPKDRRPDRRRLVRRCDERRRREDCRFRRAVFIEESNVGAPLAMPPDQTRLQRIAADDDPRQIRAEWRVIFGQRRGIGGRRQHDCPHCAAPTRRQAMESGWIDAQHQGSTAAEGREDLGDRDIEGEWSGQADDARRIRIKMLARSKRVHGGAVGDCDSLRLSRAAGRVDEIGDLLRRTLPA